MEAAEEPAVQAEERSEPVFVVGAVEAAVDAVEEKRTVAVVEAGQ